MNVYTREYFQVDKLSQFSSYAQFICDVMSRERQCEL